MKVITLRLSEDDREQLERIAKAHGVTLSWLVREGQNVPAGPLPQVVRGT